MREFAPDGIDINMGCPVPKIAGKSLAGAALMKHQDKAVEIVKRLKEIKLGVPVSVKTRLGWFNDREIVTFAPKLEAAGADLLTLHGRTKIQGYSGRANWDIIGEIKRKITIPLIANGDITSDEDIQRCLVTTGADGIMIGRAALGNPWIFSDKIPDREELVETILRHAELHLCRYGENSINTFRKHLAYYLKGDRIKIFNQGKELKGRLLRVSSLDEMKEILTQVI